VTLDVMFSQKKTDWETPEDLFAHLDNLFDIGLDACATPENAKCKKYYTETQNSLEQSWSVGAHQAVFCNPPYGRGLDKWLRKGQEEIAAGHCPRVVFLLPARTDTRWFHDYVWDSFSHHPRTGVELQFINGRLRFENAESSAPFPSIIVVMRSHTGQEHD
jgi:phage N-6-adenine-methyltransferase